MSSNPTHWKEGRLRREIDPERLCRNARGMSADSRRVAWFLESLSRENWPAFEQAAVAAGVAPRPVYTDPELAEIEDELCAELGPRCVASTPSPQDRVEALIEHINNGRDIGASLLELERRASDQVAAQFYRTNVGQEIWEALDGCLRSRWTAMMVGGSGRGKTAAATAWCAAHRGEARMVTVPGYGCQLDFFKALARALGIPHNAARAAGQLRFRIEDLLRRSGLVLVIDEGHFLLRHSSEGGRPPLLDWVDAALVDAGVPVAIVATPQFTTDLAEIERRSGWNSEQFKRRFALRWVNLPSQTSPRHMRALAERLLPGVGARGWEVAARYAESQRDVSTLADLVRDAAGRAREAGRDAPAQQDLKAALELDRFPSDNALAAAFAPRGGRRTAGGVRVPCEPSAEALPVRGQRPAPAPDFVPNREVQPFPHPAGAAG